MEARPMRIAVASGKGGTGKTTVAANLFYVLNRMKQPVQLLDCDVEAPNASIFIRGKEVAQEKAGIKIPFIDKNICTYCGTCASVCNYNALVFVKQIPELLLMEDLCHGCGACSVFCPAHAITERKKTTGYVTRFQVSPHAELVEGRLSIGEAMPTPVIRAVKKSSSMRHTLIYDAPPGTSCSMVESVEEADYVVLVSEPTPFGVHDARLAYAAIRAIGKEAGLVINRAGLGDQEIYAFAREEMIPVLLEIPFDERIAAAYARGELLCQALPEYEASFQELYSKIVQQIQRLQVVS